MPLVAPQTSPYPIIHDRVISLDEAASIAGVSSWTLKRARTRGEIQILQLSPRRIGIRLSALDRWINSRAQVSTSGARGVLK